MTIDFIDFTDAMRKAGLIDEPAKDTAADQPRRPRDWDSDQSDRAQDRYDNSVYDPPWLS